MTSLLKQFLERWKQRHSTSDFVIDPNDVKCLVIAAKSEEVGPLRIYDEGEELTVEIGYLFHTHFSQHIYSTEDRSEGMSEEIDACVDFVEQVIQDKYSFELRYSQGQCISSACQLDGEGNDEETETSFQVESPSPITDVKKFRWSGPI